MPPVNFAGWLIECPFSQEEEYKAKLAGKEVEFYRQHMEYFLIHFIECHWRACWRTMYQDVIKPYLNDVELVKKVLKSDAIILKDSPHKEYVVHVEDYNLRENPNETMKIYPQLYMYLREVENEEVKSFIENLWSIVYPFKPLLAPI